MKGWDLILQHAIFITNLSFTSDIKGLEVTMMERLIDLHGDRVVKMLTTQYRFTMVSDLIYSIKSRSDSTHWKKYVTERTECRIFKLTPMAKLDILHKTVLPPECLLSSECNIFSGWTSWLCVGRLRLYTPAGSRPVPAWPTTGSAISRTWRGQSWRRLSFS